MSHYGSFIESHSGMMCTNPIKLEGRIIEVILLKVVFLNFPV